MYKVQCFIVIGILHVAPISAALSITGQSCGTKNCSLNEFCNSFDNHCEKCESVCNDPSHNFDSQICEKQCQDYLHEIRYGKLNTFEDDIRKLQQQQRTNTILLVIILVILIVICLVRIVNWLRKKRMLSICFLKKIKPVKTTNNGGQATVGNENLSPINIEIARNAGNIIGPGTHVLSISGTDVTMPTLTTPITNRYPAENNTNEYSYDNAALQVTPSTDKPKGSETTF